MTSYAWCTCTSTHFLVLSEGTTPTSSCQWLIAVVHPELVACSCGRVESSSRCKQKSSVMLLPLLHSTVTKWDCIPGIDIVVSSTEIYVKFYLGESYHLLPTPWPLQYTSEMQRAGSMWMTFEVALKKFCTSWTADRRLNHPHNLFPQTHTHTHTHTHNVIPLPGYCSSPACKGSPQSPDTLTANRIGSLPSTATALLILHHKTMKAYLASLTRW